ncbi:MAG TPA: fibronectin type III domain-containing protein [Arthrobacter sp.]
MTATVVVGILVAGVLAAVLGVIPWVQDNAAKQDLSAARTAEGTHAAKDKGFVNLAGLQSAKYLPQSTQRLTVSANDAGTCYLGVAKSQSGTVFYATDKANEPREMTPETASTPGTTAVPCLGAGAVQDMVGTVGGYDPRVYTPVGSGSGTTTSPGTAVKDASTQISPVSPAPGNTNVSTTAVTVVDQAVKVTFQNTSSSAATVNYGARITCYDPSRNATTVQDTHGYFDLNSNIFADMVLVACTPGTQPVDIVFFPYDTTWAGTGTVTGTYFHWRGTFVFPQATWVSRGLTSSYDGLWCIENQNNAATAGNHINLAPCASVDAQRWQWNGDGEIRQSTLDHKCSASAADKMVLADCSAEPGQVFTAQLFQGSNSTGGLVQIIDKASGKCLDVPGGSLSAVQLAFATCSGAGTQSWYMPGLATTLTAALQQPQPAQLTPSAPANLSATAYPATTANFSWAAVKDATGYHVDYRLNGGTWQVQSDTQTATTVSFAGSPNDVFDVRVTAKNATGESGYSTASLTLPGLTVINGSFENGMTGWTTGGSTQATAVAGGHSGNYSALVGNVASTDGSVSQTVQVASSGTSTLSFWYSPRSGEPSCGCDWAEAQIRDSSGAVLQNIFKGNADTPSWINKTVDLTPYRGQAVTFWFNVHNDSGILTSAYLDDVVVTNSVSTVPAAPVQVFASRNGNNADLSWKQTSDGGAPVTASTVTPIVDGAPQAPITVSGSQTSLTVNNLTAGTYYAFAVTATNEIGTSAASSPSTPFQNGSFESGLASWTTGGNAAPAPSPFGTSPGRNGSATVTLGNQVSSDSSIAQTVQVPESGTSTLSFWYLQRSSEPGCGCDWTEAEIRDQSGAVLKPIFKNNGDGTSWQNKTVDLTPFNGQKVMLWINVHNDSSNLSYTSVDDVAITTGPATLPAAPIDVTAVRTGTTVDLAWKQPNDGGSWVTTYTVTPSVNGAVQAPILVTGSPAARSLSIPSLAADSNYSYTVTATTAIGSSGPSLSSTTVLNSSFESELTSWTTGGSKAPTRAWLGYAGAKSVLLGNQLSTDSSVSQNVDVPATGTTTVSFWLQPHSAEPGCGCDWTELQIRDASTGALLKQAYKANGDSTAWLNPTSDLTAFKGKKVTLWFNMHNDSSLLSYSYLDDVRVTTAG